MGGYIRETHRSEIYIIQGGMVLRREKRRGRDWVLWLTSEVMVMGN